MAIRAIEKYATQGEITLPGIEEKITLPHHVWFKYEGAVSSIPHSLARSELIIHEEICSDLHDIISRILNWPIDQICINTYAENILQQDPDFKKIAGYCFGHKVSQHEIAYVIAKRKKLPRNKSIFADGHESGELLQSLKQQKVMQDLLDQANIRVLAHKYQGEDFADIGGLLALRQAAMTTDSQIDLPIFHSRNQVLRSLTRAFGY